MVTPIAFLKETLDELQKVTWPKKDDIIRLTITILLVSLLVGLFIGGVDLALTKFMETIVK